MGNSGSHDHPPGGSCLESLIEVFLFIDGQLDPDRIRAIQEHISYCHRCYGKVEFERLFKDYLKTKCGHEVASESVTSKIKQMLRPR